MKATIKNITSRKVALAAALLILILSNHTTVVAQSRQVQGGQHYMGFDVSFGRHAFESASNLTPINRHNVALDGGQVGITYGNDLYRCKIGLLGYYSSVSDIAGTVDLYTNNVSINFYPLTLIGQGESRVQPYIAAGAAYDRYKFSGYYLSDDPGKINYSTSEAPYLGSIRQSIATLGAGLNVKILDDNNFIHFFTEMKYGKKITNATTESAFDQTALRNQMMINFGLSFGAHR